MDDLKDLYLDQLADLVSACDQSRDVTVEMERAAADETLKDALHRGHKGIEAGAEAMRGILARHGREADGEHCVGMEGLVKEARKHALEEDFADPALRDATILAQYQRMAHYAIAGYGTAAAFARRLGLEDDAATIAEHLDHTRHGDETMTGIAEGRVNPAAS